MNFYRLIKSKTFLFGIVILTAYIVISAIIYNSVILKMENDMNADNNIQLETIKLSNSIRLTIDSAQDVVYFSRENDKKRVKTSLLKLSALIGLTNKRFEPTCCGRSKRATGVMPSAQWLHSSPQRTPW